MHIDLSATSIWKIDIDVSDDSGPVDMTGLSCLWVMSSRADNTEVARASTTAATGHGTIAIVTGPTGAGRSRLQITIDEDDHDGLVVPNGFVMIDGNLSLVVTGGYEWLGKQQFRVWAGPNWTGATGA